MLRPAPPALPMTLTEDAVKANQCQIDEAAHYSVRPSHAASGVAFVCDDGRRIKQYRRVHLSDRSCSCTYPSQHGKPCRHMVAAITYFRREGMEWDVNALYLPLYRVDSLASAFADLPGGELPLPDAVRPCADVLVHLKQRKERAAKRKRIPSSGEHQIHSRISKCSRCRSTGHNSRTCSSGVQNNIM